MCGINGIFARTGETVDVGLVEQLRDLFTHRGPDDCGVWARPDGQDVVLGHRRLTIVDLSEAGRQPMGNEDGSVQVTFNGEIYNHAELRRDLESRGHRFRSRCDTEVLVHLYEEEGPEMVQRLVGMFAFAIWDDRRQRLFLARDRMGIKPLYWLDDGRQFAFASEIKGLLPLLTRREIDPTALSHYLTFIAVPAPRTLFAGVSKLAPGETMIVERGGPQPPRRYWDPLVNRAQFSGSAAEWEAELRLRLERSIERRMMSDVPFGVFLSGGVDSSTNVALMSQMVDQPVNTFSIGYEGQEQFNEFSWARRVAEQFKTNHHEVKIDAQDLWKFMPELVYYQDEPIADPVCVPVYFVSKLAKDNGVTVVQVGEGADELLAGYATYVQAHAYQTGLWQRLRGLPRPVRSAAARTARRVLASRPGYEIHLEALDRAAAPNGRLWWGGAIAFYERGLARISTDRLSREAGGPTPGDLVGAIAAEADREGADDLAAMIYQDLRIRLPELLLMRVDKLTMANAVEARVPFLDHELVELAMAMPSEMKIRDGVGKQPLKRAVSDLLPHDLIWRPKQGFGTPVAEWFRGELGDQLAAQLRGSALNETGYLDPLALEGLLEQHRSGRAERSLQLWNVLNLSMWFDHWIAREPVAV